MIDQHDSLAEKFIKKWFWLYLFWFIVAPLWYIVKIIISWELEVREVWILYWVMSLMVLLSSFNDLWMAESLNKFIPEYVTKKRYDKVKTILTYAILAQIITWIIIFIIFYFWAWYLSINYFKDSESLKVIQIFAFYFLANNFFHVQNVFFQAVQNTFAQKICDTIRMILVLWITVFLFLADLWSLHTYSLSWVLAMLWWVWIASFIFYKKYYKIYLNNEKIIFEKELFLKIFKYALLVFLWAQASTILSQIDMQMIIYLLNNESAWYFTNYLSIISIPFMIIWPIFWLMFPIFSEMHAKNEIDKIKMVKQIFTKNFLSFSIVFSILFFVFWEIISTILFWDKFITSWTILKYSVLFISFNFLLQINFNIFAAIGQVKQRLNIILIAIVFNTILNYVLIKWIWVAWASLATWMWWILIWLLSELKLKEYRVSFDFKYLLKNVWVFSIIWIIMYYYVLPIFSLTNSRIYECLILAWISIIYFALFAVLNITEYKYFLSEIKNIRKKS